MHERVRKGHRVRVRESGRNLRILHDVIQISFSSILFLLFIIIGWLAFSLFYTESAAGFITIINLLIRLNILNGRAVHHVLIGNANLHGIIDVQLFYVLVKFARTKLFILFLVLV